MRCLLVGNFGVGNWGDEALRHYFETSFPEVEWTIVTERGDGAREVPRLPLKPHLLFRSWFRTIRAYRRCDAVVFGGGALFTDIEGIKASLMWSAYAMVARLFGKPYAMAFQGVGPFRTRMGVSLSRGVFRRASFVSVRDPLSAGRLREMGVINLHETFDPIILLLQKEKVPAFGSMSGIIPRKNSPEGFIEEAARFASTDVPCKIILFEPDALAERRLAARLRMAIPGASISDVRTFGDAMREIGECSTVLSMRFHASLIAHVLRKNVVVQTQYPNDKHSALDAMVRVQGMAALAESARKGEEMLRAWMGSRGRLTRSGARTPSVAPEKFARVSAVAPSSRV